MRFSKSYLTLSCLCPYANMNVSLCQYACVLMLLCICPYAEKEWDSENEEWVDLTGGASEVSVTSSVCVRTQNLGLTNPNTTHDNRSQKRGSANKNNAKRNAARSKNGASTHCLLLYHDEGTSPLA